MNTHTLCLNILIILFTISPVLLIGIISNFPGMKMKKDDVFFTKALAYLLIIEFTFILIMKFHVLKVSLPENIYWYFIAIVCVPLIIALEILLAFIMIKAKGKNVKKLSFWGSGKKLDKYHMIFILIIAIFEELIFRCVWSNILGNDFGINLYIVIAISAVVYGFNHLFMGSKIIVQKTVTGCIYGLLYFLSGSIIIPIITHCVQNYFVIARGERCE